MVATTLAQLVENPYAKKKYLLILKPYDLDAAGELTLYFSGEGFVTEPTDTPANTIFEPRLVEPILANARGETPVKTTEIVIEDE